MPCLCGRLMQGLCGRLMRYAYALLMHNICAKIECLVASTGGLCSPLCGPYARLMHRSDRETARRKERETKTEGDRGRERETEKETDAQRPRANRVAHRALCKPLMRISLNQQSSCCLCAASFPLSGAVFWLMRAYASPTLFEESPYAGLCGSFFL